MTDEEIKKIAGFIASHLSDEFTAETIKSALASLAPCLIDGHEADDDPAFFYLFDGNEYGDHFPIKRKDSNHPIAFKLCARCGVVYEEKAK